MILDFRLRILDLLKVENILVAIKIRNLKSKI